MHHFVHPLVHFDIIVGTFCLLRYKAVENLPAFALNAGEETWK